MAILSISIPGYAGFYRYNIDELARKAKARLQEIDEKIAEEKLEKELENVLAEARTIIKEAEILFSEKRYEEAAQLYRKIEKMSEKPDIRKMLDASK